MFFLLRDRLSPPSRLNLALRRHYDRSDEDLGSNSEVTFSRVHMYPDGGNRLTVSISFRDLTPVKMSSLDLASECIIEFLLSPRLRDQALRRY